MTLLVGIKCADGVVLGADGAVSLSAQGRPLARHPVRDKLQIIGDRLVAGFAGAVGIGQQLLALLGQLIVHPVPVNGVQRRLLECEAITAGGILEQTMHPLVLGGMERASRMTNLTGSPAFVQAALCELLVAFPCAGEANLFNWDQQHPLHLATRDLFHVSMGSGQVVADPFLAFLRRLLWGQRLPDVEEGVLAAAWTLRHAIDVSAEVLGDPIQIITLRRSTGEDWKARELSEEERRETLETVARLEHKIGAVFNDLRRPAPSEGPPAVGG